MVVKKILVVVGTRPNFIKVTQLKKEAEKYPNLDLKIVHTGQHFDSKMADVFFEQFNLIPDYFLNVQAGDVMEQITKTMVALSELINTTFTPQLMMVVGDVNSTLAAALVANKLNIKLAHIESGLRSYDRTMPEEHNRMVTDVLSDYYFVTEKDGLKNLKEEGKNKDAVFFVGNTMIDTMVAFNQQIEASDVLNKLKLQQKKYVLLTMHRPATVDNKDGLQKLLDLIESITKNDFVVFPIHPRTLKNLEQFGLLNRFQNNPKIIKTEPLDYFAFQNLILHCKYILTDSGGIQEESTFLKIPCITLRPNTERPITVEIGSNTLMPFDVNKLLEVIDSINNNTYKKSIVPELWDGKATQRIMLIVNNLLSY
jgi:UDP-N-acetylglucosamine 2-epimerase (non-hydrolysing)